MSKIVLLAGANSIHTIRWANGLKLAGHDVYLISQHRLMHKLVDGIKYYELPIKGILGYFLNVSKVKKIIHVIKPDIVNAHYASGYGTTARLANIRPLVLSVWGSDVYDFPYKSFLHKRLVQKNLMAADTIASTSYCMADQTHLIEPKLGHIFITPFGVDIKAYAHIEPLALNSNKVVIGTVKTMADKYGIDTLIEAFTLLYNKLSTIHPNLADKLELRLIGGGGKLEELQQLAKRLNIAHKVNFIGQVAHQDVPNELAKLDIYVALSRLDSESFGVAIIEAGAAGRPVIVSDAGGLPEVTINNTTGFVVQRENPQMAAEAMENLVLNPELRLKMGEAARQHVKEKYSWSICVKVMEEVFLHTIVRYREN